MIVPIPYSTPVVVTYIAMLYCLSIIYEKSKHKQSLSFYVCTFDFSVWYTAIVEVAVIAVLTVFSFSLGLVITSGLSRTCDTVLDINKEENK